MPEIRPAAIADTRVNGYDDTNATISVNVPPSMGLRQGVAGFVEVIIQQQVPTYFIQIAGFNSATGMLQLNYTFSPFR